MENEKDTTPETTHSDEVVNDSADSKEAGSDEAQAPEESGERELDKAEMQKTLNKQFTEIDTLKKQIEANKAAPVTNSNQGDLEKQLSELQDRVNQSDFYKANPQYENYKDLLGNNPAESIKNETLKVTIDKAIEADASDQSKSILQTNPRIGQATDKLSSAKEKLVAANKAATTGDIATVTQNQDEAGKDATSAVIDAYGL